MVFDFKQIILPIICAFLWDYWLPCFQLELCFDFTSLFYFQKTRYFHLHAIPKYFNSCLLKPNFHLKFFHYQKFLVYFNDFKFSLPFFKNQEPKSANHFLYHWIHFLIHSSFINWTIFSSLFQKNQSRLMKVLGYPSLCPY
jgi:hypothetical protein